MSEEPTPEKPKRGRPLGTGKKVIRQVEEYHDPIDVTLTMKGGLVDEFSCVDYDTSGSVWKFKSFPKERGRQTMRLVNPSEVASVVIDEPEGRAPMAAAAPVPPLVYPAVPTGPVAYVARDPAANRSVGGLRNGIPVSVAKDENGNMTTLNAAMLGAGDIG